MTACDLRAARVLECHGQPRDAEEIELIGDRVKHRGDQERHERHLHAGCERRELRDRRIPARTAFHRPRASEAEKVQPGEEQESRDTEIDGVLQVDVVDRAPCRLAARLVERDHVLPEADPDDRVVRDDLERDPEVLVSALRRPGFILLHVRDGAQPVDV